MALLDERERNQQYIKSRDQENEDIALTVGKLRVELEEAKSKLNEQREYYEGVISDGSKRIAELEAREIKPAKGEVLVVVSGFTGCGKSAIAGEIEIAMKAIGVPVQWTNGDAEKRMTGADWLTAIEMYKPTVRIVEVNVPRALAFASKETQENKTMKNRKAKLLLLSRSTGYEKLPISNHKRAVIGMFGRVVFAFNYKPTASRNRREKGYAVR